MKIATSIFKTFLLSLMMIAQVHFAFAQAPGSILPNARTIFIDKNGKPLTGGSVQFYIPPGTTPKTTWQDQAETIPNTNPVILQSDGGALIWGTGTYRQVVRDRNNNLIWDQTTSSAGSGGGSTPTATGDGDLVGTIKPWAGLAAPNQYMLTYGQQVSRATYSALFTAITSSQAIFCSVSSPILTGLSDTTNFPIGANVEVPCLVAGQSTIISKTSTTITMAANSNVSLNTTAIIYPWGNGNGSTTFNLPDFRGFAIAGNNNMGGVASSVLTTNAFGNTNPNSIGAAGGSQYTTLFQNNLPSINFTVASGQTVSVTSTATNIVTSTSGFASVVNTGGGQGAFASNSGQLAAAQVSTGTVTNTGTAASGGSSVPISLIQPTKTSNYIIKVTPDANSATASGVTDINGMTGSIGCSTGLVCTGNNISVVFPSIVQQFFGTIALAEAATIGPGVSVVTTSGFNSIGDNGGANYIRIGSSTAAPWRFQSADGQWWALNNRTVTPEMFGASGDGTSDNTSAFTAFATWFNGFTNGGVTFNFSAGAVYKIWPSGSSPSLGLMTLNTNVNGLTVNFNGSQFTTDNLFTTGTTNPRIFFISAANGLTINDPWYVQTAFTTLSSTQGGQLVFIFETSAPFSTNIIINNGIMTGGNSFLEVSPRVASPGTIMDNGIVVNNAQINSVYYGLNFQESGDNVTARGIRCHNVGRCYFPYNVSNHDVQIESDGGGPFNDILLKVYGDPTATQERNSLTNIKIQYRNVGRSNNTASYSLANLSFQQLVAAPVVSGAASHGGLVQLTVDTTANMATGQTWYVNSVGGNPGTINTLSWIVTVIDGTHVDLQGSTFSGSYTSGGYVRVPASLKNIDLQMFVASDANGQPNAVNTYKLDSSGTADTVANGYVIDNIKISGKIKNYNSGIAAIDLFNNDFSVPNGSLGTWTGETIRNIGLSDLVINGTNTSVLINAAPISSGLALEHIYSTPTTVAWTLTSPGANTSILDVNATGVINQQTVVYSTGTWIPAITASSTAGTPAYSIQVGSYTQIGNTVTAWFDVQLSGWSGSPIGNLTITGLPITAGSTTNDYGSCMIHTSLTSSSVGGLTGRVAASSSVVTLLQLTAGGGTGTGLLTETIAGTTPLLVGSCTYHT